MEKLKKTVLLLPLSLFFCNIIILEAKTIEASLMLQQEQEKDTTGVSNRVYQDQPTTDGKTEALDEIVVVGFAQQKRANLTGAVASIDVGKTLDSRPLTDISKGLQGTTPGLNIAFNSGNISRTANINIRGAGTIVDGEIKGSPLVLVDGVPSDLSLINPEDVASMSVLKDAASASIYGARAAFGVILITTKSGTKTKEVKFAYSGNTSWRNPISLLEFNDPTVELPGMMKAAARKGESPELFGQNYQVLLDGIVNWKDKYGASRSSDNKEMVYGEDWEIINGVPYFYRVWEPHEEMLATNSLQMFHNFSAQGNIGENSSFIASIGYSDQDGMYKVNQENKKRYNINLGLTTKLTKWLDAGFKVMTIMEEYDYPFNHYSNGTDESGNTGYYGYYMRWGKMMPYGTYRGYGFRQSNSIMAESNMNKRNSDLYRLNGKLTATITKDLNVVGEYSLSTSYKRHKLNGGTVTVWDNWAAMPYDEVSIQTAIPSTQFPGDDYVAQSSSSSITQVFNAYLNYTKSIDEIHNFKVIGGMNSDWQSYEQIYAQRKTLLDKDNPEFKLAAGDMSTVSPNSSMAAGLSQYAILGFFGRINYDYKGIYLLELNGRYDGSSKFSPTNQWGFFPSLSVGYRISQESFMDNTRSWLSDAKIRASYGSIGNQNIANNAFLSVMNNSNAWWINSTNSSVMPSVGLPSNVDPLLTWESVKTKDVGIDLLVLNMIGLTFDWYQRDTEGMLSPGKTLPSSFGQTAANTNAGNLQTNGWELAVNFNKKINDKITVYSDLSLSDYTTKVTEWNNPTKLLGSTSSYYAGQTIGEIWGLTSNRLIQADDVVNATGTNVNGIDYSLLNKNSFKFGAGDVLYEDINGDGKITKGAGTADDSGDLKVIGNTTPHYQYGIRLGSALYGFDVDIFFQGVAQRDYWAASDVVLPFYRAHQQMYANQNDYWTTENTGAFWPNPFAVNETAALSSGTTGSNNFITQTRYLLNMAYFRLKNITVGYSLPSTLIQKIKLDKVRLYVSGENLWTIKDARLPVDPEINESEIFWGRTYPFTNAWSVGLQLNF